MYRLQRRLSCLVLVALALAPWPAAAQTAVTLKWDQPSPASVTGYRVSQDGAWRDYGSALVGAGGTCICSVTLSLAAGPHTLIVAAYNASGESASAPLVYTVAVPTSPPGASTAAIPASGSTSGSTSPTLTWSAAGATTYDLRLDTANPPTTVVASALTTAAYQKMLTAGTVYFWQVVARNSAGSTTGAVWSFTTPTTGLPAIWTNQDIGSVGVAGSATYTTGTFTVTGGGLDIWGTADAFQYVSQPLSGDGAIVARVITLQNTHLNAKAGVMMRGALTAGAAHVMLNSAVDGSIEFISRSAAGGAATFIAGSAQARPAWVKLARTGATVTGSVSSDGKTWSVVGSASLAGLASTGLVVTSGDPLVRNVSTFDSVTVTLPAVITQPVVVLPGVPGTASPATAATNVATATRLTWSASGATTYDVKLGTTNPPATAAASNQAAAAYQPTLLAGIKYFWQVVARNSAGTTAGPVWSFTTASAATTTGAIPAPWTSQDIGSVGVAGSATYTTGTFTVTGGGLDIWGTADAFQYVSQPLSGDGAIVARVITLQNTHLNAKAGVMMRGALTAGAAHVMLNSAVDGSIEFISRSAAGGAATFIAGGAQARPAWVKLARTGATVTGSVSSDGKTWSVVGSASLAGLASTGLVVTSGDPLVRNVSTFDSVTVTLPAVITQPVVVLPGVPGTASPATAATNVATATRLTWSASGATTYDVKLGTTNPPATAAASNQAAAAYQPTLLAGIKYFWQVVARNSAGTTAGPVWSFTTASAATTTGAIPAPWTSQDIGSVGVAGSATYTTGTFTVTGGGLDIWGAADAFRYVSQPFSGDATIVARVTTLQNTHLNAKAGVMMRGALTAGAAHVMLNSAVDGSIEFISRSAAGGTATFIAGGAQARPAWVKLARTGTTVTGSVSSDGKTWSVVGSTGVAGLALTGLVVTSGDPLVRNVSTFDSVAVTRP